MAFLAAMNSAVPAGMTTGVNGAAVYTPEGVGDMRVAFYQSLVRGMGSREIQEFIGKVYAEGVARGQVEEYVRDLWVMAFQARDVRGGKGERTISLEMLRCLAESQLWPAHMGEVIQMLVEYGSWRDVFVLYKMVTMCPGWRDSILREVEAQFWKDIQALRNAEKPKLSLLGKWMPREGSAMDNGLVDDLCARLYAVHPRAVRRRMYRRHCAMLNAALRTVEVPMCGGRWATIKPDGVPGRALKNYRLAFANKKKNGKERYATEDRRVCAANFAAHLEKALAGKVVVKGGDTVMPHEIVKPIYESNGVTEDQLVVLEAQWMAIRAKFAEAAGARKMVPMCDFSGSMSGIPLLVSLGLGLLVSEINHPAFRGGLMTFGSTPTWLQFSDSATLKEQILLTMVEG